MKLAIPQKKIESNKKKVFHKKESYWYSEDGDLTKQLFRAAEIGDYEDMLYLLGQGADPNAENSNSETPLLIAAKEGYEDIAELLINHGADINFQNQYDETPFLCAIKEGNKKLIELLFEKGFEPDGDDMAWLAEDLDLFSFVLDKFADKVDQNSVLWEEVLERAVKEKNTHAISEILFFLKYKKDELLEGIFDDACRYVLQEAVDAENASLIDTIFGVLSDDLTLDAVVYPNKQRMILHNAISDCNSPDCAVAIIKNIKRYAPDLIPSLSLLESGVFTPLMNAAALEDDKGEPIVKALLESGVDVNQGQQDRKGFTALIRAIWAGNKGSAVLLVSDATPEVLDKQDAYGNTALIHAVKANNPELVALLLEAGADIDIRNDLGETAFSLARKGGLDEIEQLLLDQM